MAQGRGAWVSDVPYAQSQLLTTGATFPTAAQPIPDALIVTSTLTALTITTQDGTVLTWSTTFPVAGTILPIAATAVTFAPAAALAALYR